MRPRRLIAILGITTVLVVSAGCTGLLGPGTDVSKVDTGVNDDNVPYIAYNYTVQDYADAILEAPNGDIVAERQLSPETGRSAFRLRNPRGGTYTIAIQEGGETKVTEEVEFEGPNPEVVSLNGVWSGPTLEQIQVEIRNTGDLPVQVSEVAVEARDQVTSDSSMYTWLDQNESAQFSASGSYGETITVEKSGNFEGSVSIVTSVGTIQDTIYQEFEGPSIEIISINQEWEGNELIDVETEVRNSGDLPAEVNVTLGNPDPQYFTGEETVEAHSVTKYDFESVYYGNTPLYWAESGGNQSLELVANFTDGFASETIYHEVEGATVEIESMTPSWEYGQLNSVSYSVTNNGEIEAETEIIATINGEEISSDSVSVAPGDTETDEIAGAFGSLYSVESGGEYMLKLAAKGYNSNIKDSISFDGTDAEISNVEASFGSVYDSEKVELTSVDFEMANGGDIIYSYSDVRVTLDGATRTSSPIITELQPGESTSVSEYYIDGIAVSPGQYDLTIEILDGGEITASRTYTVTAG